MTSKSYHQYYAFYLKILYKLNELEKHINLVQYLQSELFYYKILFDFEKLLKGLLPNASVKPLNLFMGI